LLAFPHGADPADDVHDSFDSVKRHPHTAYFHAKGEKFLHPWHPDHRTEDPSHGNHSPNAGQMAVQVCRSSADWSSGILKEQSIQNAYIELIRTANHYIYIENQFFITSTQKDGKVVNVIGAALVERILSAAKDGRKFKIVVIIPTIPCFSGELPEAAGIRCIMAYQYKSINRGGKSIFEMVEEAGVDPNEYISFYHLRGYDRLNNDPEMIKKMEETSGVTYHQAEVASARLFLGDQGYVSGQKVAIKVPVQGGEELDSEGKKKPPKVEEVVMPSSEEEAREIINKFRE